MRLPHVRIYNLHFTVDGVWVVQHLLLTLRPYTFNVHFPLFRISMKVKECYVIFSSLHRFQHIIVMKNIAPITNLFPRYHVSKHYYRTCVGLKWDTHNNKKINKIKWFIFPTSIVKQWLEIHFSFKKTSIRGKKTDRGRASLTIS